MDSIQICGQTVLRGEVSVQGSKNVTLPILAATILIPGVTVIYNCPDIADISHMIKLLECVGCKVLRTKNTITVDAKDVRYTELPGKYVKTMRSSVMLLGAMLARVGEVTLHYPGGCVIGERPIDLHKEALQCLGAVFCEENACIHARVLKFKGGKIQMRFPSVGATQNAILGAVMAEGETMICGASIEPEVTEVVRFLNSAGADIRMDGGGNYLIRGVKRLHETRIRILPDRIVAGTYLLAAVATRGGIVLHDAPVSQMTAVIDKLRALGAFVICKGDTICIEAEKADKALPYLETKVYPGFPTDLQSPMLTVLALAKGVSVVCETIFENRFQVAGELAKMGADIRTNHNTAVIEGVKKFHGTKVDAKELRGGAALVIAGLCAEGVTTIENRHFIDRGYEDICRDIRQLGGDIR